MTSQWSSWRLKLPVIRLFVQPFVRLKSKKTSKLSLLTFCEGNTPMTGGSQPHPGHPHPTTWSGKTPYRQILWSLEAARLDVIMIALKFCRHLVSATAKVTLRFQSDWKSLNHNLVASRLHESVVVPVRFWPCRAGGLNSTCLLWIWRTIGLSWAESIDTHIRPLLPECWAPGTPGKCMRL